MSILFIGDKSNSSELAAKILQQNFSEVLAIFYDHGETFPKEVYEWKGDWILSYKSDLILSEDTLNKAHKGAINIHPAPPKYRGIGGYQHAINNKDKKYGVTSHFMDTKIDHGKIILVKYFPIHDIRDPKLLKEVTAQYCIGVLQEVIGYILDGQPLPISKEKWRKKLYTYKELKEKVTN